MIARKVKQNTKQQTHKQIMQPQHTSVISEEMLFHTEHVEFSLMKTGKSSKPKKS